MSLPNLTKYIYDGSPFVPQLPHSFIKDAKKQVDADQAPPQLIFAKDLLAVGDLHNQYLIDHEKELYQKFKTTGNDLYYFILGYSAPLVLINLAFGYYSGGQALVNEYFRYTTTTDEESRKMNEYFRKSVTTCYTSLLHDTTCSGIFDYAINNPFSGELYYRVGVECAKVIFFTCNVTLLKMMGMDY